MLPALALEAALITEHSRPAPQQASWSSAWHSKEGDKFEEHLWNKTGKNKRKELEKKNDHLI